MPEGRIDFTGKTVLITGAGSGLGRAHALGFAERGANVIVNDMTGADDVAAEVQDKGAQSLPHTADITNEQSVAEMVSEGLDHFGGIDILINNAGVLRDKSFHKMETADWSKVIDVHLNGARTVTKTVWPHMRNAGGGRIVMTTSSSGLFGNFGQSNYGAAKMALIGLMNTLIIEGEKAGICVNAIAPIAWTAMTASLFPPAAETLMAPEKVTPGVLFLASEHAPSGMILCAGGGAYSSVRLEQTPAIALGADAAVDDLVANSDALTDFSNSHPPKNGPLHTAEMFQAAMKRM